RRAARRRRTGRTASVSALDGDRRRAVGGREVGAGEGPRGAEEGRGGSGPPGGASEGGGGGENHRRRGRADRSELGRRDGEAAGEGGSGRRERGCSEGDDAGVAPAGRRA